MNPKVILAVFKRNFTSYFSSPIGYVFICAFVLLTGFAAFWPNEFFNANLATLDQLNQYIPWILLVFIPAISMSVWADERRQGTDELLLTLPCSDLDVVIGKYLAALSIYTVALLFSISNIFILKRLGNPDLGLIFGNLAGYWLAGAALISIGMVASFLTNSLTVAFILALAFNAPLVFANSADTIISWEPLARFLRGASIAGQFDDFGKGLITFAGVVYFTLIAVVSLYVSMILIGRRHWAGGAYGRMMSGHFAIRSVAVVGLAIGLVVLAGRLDVRADVSHERINSLSPQTRQLLKNIDSKRPVYVEAYVSPHVPEEYVQQRMNLLSMLREAHAIAGDKVIVRIHNTERFSEDEAQAEAQFGIRPQQVQSSAGGKFSVDQIMLGAAFMCGLDKVVVPFFDRSTPVEYEITRSIATVSQQSRKKIGVLATDAKMFGGFEMESMSQRPAERIVEELKKQYDVVQVNPDQPIVDRYDAMLAVQPSSMSEEQLQNFIGAVRRGQPTAIFEDPLPVIDPSVPATSQPRMPPQRNPFQQPPPPLPKGNIGLLWSLLGVTFNDREIIWQDYNPYPKLEERFPEFIFIGKGSGAEEPFAASNPATGGLQQLLALFAGSISPANGATTRFEPLMETGRRTGVVAFDDILRRGPFGPAGINPDRRQRQTGQTYVLAARITGPGAPTSTVPPTTAPTAHPSMNVVLVSDIDVLYSVFFNLRARDRDQQDPLNLNLDNVTFVLNTLDYLAGDDRFIDIRKRRPAYRTLSAVETRTEAARQKANDERDKFLKQFEDARDQEQKKLDQKIEELKARQGIDQLQMMQEVGTAQQAGQNRLNAAIQKMEKERDAQLDRIERDLSLNIRSVQNKYKLAAILFPPIPPLLLGAWMFHRRRTMEHIGVPKARLR